MSTLKKTFLAILVSTFFALPAIASQAVDAQDANVQTMTLELQSADVATLKLSTVENEADENSNEIHQESSVGRAGLQGACLCFPDGNGGYYCQ